MLIVAAVIFGLAAIGGITLATLHFKGTPPPLWVGPIHAAIAACGFVSLVVGVIRNAERAPISGGTGGGFAVGALVMFSAAIVLGIIQYGFHKKKGTIPRRLIFVHATAAVFGLTLLILAISQDHP